MPLQISHLRRWFALGAIGMVLLVAGMYLYARHKVRNALKEVPEKIGLEVQQTAQGFTISRSEQGHTLFKVQASKAIQFKQGGRAELHDVAITLYGRDSTRFDQIYGSDFLYDPQSGDVTAQGEVQIDLEANPQGLAKPDQAVPKELKDPIHLKTTGLTFNQKTRRRPYFCVRTTATIMCWRLAMCVWRHPAPRTPKCARRSWTC